MGKWGCLEEIWRMNEISLIWSLPNGHTFPFMFLLDNYIQQCLELSPDNKKNLGEVWVKLNFLKNMAFEVCFSNCLKAMEMELQHKGKPETFVCASVLLHEPCKNNNSDGSGLDFISWKSSSWSFKTILWNYKGVLPLGIFVYMWACVLYHNLCTEA